MNEFEVKRMTAADIENIARLEKETFSLPWSKKSLEAELDNPTALFFTAFCRGEFVGYIGANMILNEVYINNLAICKPYRRQGAASALLNCLIIEAERNRCCFITLEVRESNRGAIALYERSGFRNMGLRPGFYEEPKENAVIMTHIL